MSFPLDPNFTTYNPVNKDNLVRAIALRVFNASPKPLRWRSNFFTVPRTYSVPKFDFFSKGAFVIGTNYYYNGSVPAFPGDFLPIELQKVPNERYGFVLFNPNVTGLAYLYELISIFQAEENNVRERLGRDTVNFSPVGEYLDGATAGVVLDMRFTHEGGMTGNMTKAEIDALLALNVGNKAKPMATIGAAFGVGSEEYFEHTVYEGPPNIYTPDGATVPGPPNIYLTTSPVETPDAWVGGFYGVSDSKFWNKEHLYWSYRTQHVSFGVDINVTPYFGDSTYYFGKSGGASFFGFGYRRGTYSPVMIADRPLDSSISLINDEGGFVIAFSGVTDVLNPFGAIGGGTAFLIKELYKGQERILDKCQGMFFTHFQLPDYTGDLQWENGCYDLTDPFVFGLFNGKFQFLGFATRFICANTNTEDQPLEIFKYSTSNLTDAEYMLYRVMQIPSDTPLKAPSSEKAAYTQHFFYFTKAGFSLIN